MNLDVNLLIVGMLISTIGFGYFIYGKNTGTAMPMISGAILCAYPYFIDNMMYLLIIGAVLLALPFVVKY